MIDRKKIKTSGPLGGILGFLLFLAAAFTIGWIFHIVLGSKTQLIFPICASLFLAVIAPIIVIAIRHEIRLTRIKLIDLFANTFNLSTTPPQVRLPENGTSRTNVSFEFVKGKYYVDLDLESGETPSLKDIPRFPMMLHADWMLLLCALPFMAFSAFGVFLLFAPIIEILNPTSSISSWLWASVLSLGGSPLNLVRDQIAYPAQHANVLTVAALAFGGAYFYCIRLLLRAVAAFDLSPLTFLRAFAHMVIATTLAVVIYRVFPSIEGVVSTWHDASAAIGGLPRSNDASAFADPTAGVNSIWFILSFALGFLPDAAIQYALQKSGVKFKARYDEVEAHARIIPLTILDGIDSFTAFRLEESNIFEVQNLATFNPIMLHIETPFGIYETIDWVAQAQLCCVVGPERFLAFKMFNIRTIFDLERAVLSCGSEESTKRLVGSVLFSDCGRDAKCRAAFELKSIYGVPDATSGGQVEKVDISSTNIQKLDPKAIEHFVRLIIDDLHVHRLRQIWMLIGAELGRDYEGLIDTRKLDGESRKDRNDNTNEAKAA